MFKSKTGKPFLTLIGLLSIILIVVGIIWQFTRGKYTVITADNFTRIERIATLSGHTADITEVVWSPDNQRIASASLDGTVRIWDGNTYQLISTLSGDTSIESVAWSHSGKHLAASSVGGDVYIWETLTYKIVKVLRHTSAIHCVSWSPDDTKLVATYSEPSIMIWGMTSYTTIKKWTGQDPHISCAKWSPDGTQIASTSNDGLLRLWQAPDYESTVVDGPANIAGYGGIGDVYWSHDGKRIVVTYGYMTSIAWDVETRQILSSSPSRR
jgi:eukaryotic-like serine/threonine-protein kinase